MSAELSGKRKLIIGSRGSDLALWQANFVRDQLQKLAVEAEILIIKTQGDRIQHLSFDKMEGKGFFTKELEAALLQGEIDLAVHSHKDLETALPAGLCIAAVSERENPSDAIVAHKSAVDTLHELNLKQGAVLGTSSARRKNQVSWLRPDIELKDIRGNVPTRLEKLASGQFDAIMLATAGLRRLKLDLSAFEVFELDPTRFVPAPAQGVLALQCRENDAFTRHSCEALHHKDVAELIGLERNVLRLHGGGCQQPVGAYAMRSERGVELHVSAARQWKEVPNRQIQSAALASDLISRLPEILKKKI